MGPFVDGTQECMASGDMELLEEDESGNITGKHAASYDMVFIEKVIRDGVNSIYEAMENEGEELPTHIVMVPSLLDAHHECVYPQPGKKSFRLRRLISKRKLATSKSRMATIPILRNQKECTSCRIRVCSESTKFCSELPLMIFYLI